MKFASSDDTKKRTARDAALRKLSSRDRTEKEIRDFLAEAGYEADEAEDAVAFLKECGYLDDKNYCRKYYVYGSSKGKSRERIVRELVQKGIPAEHSRNVFEDMADDPQWQENLTDDRTNALKIGSRMARDQEASGKELDEKFMARVGRRLMGLGYESGICYYVIGKLRDYSKEKAREDEWTV